MPKQSAFPAATMQSAYGYTPKFELWMNGLIWQALYNVINSFSLLEMEQVHIEGRGQAVTHAPVDTFVQRVKILEDTVMTILRPDSVYGDDYKLAKERATYTDDDTREEMEDEVEVGHGIYRAILGLLNRGGFLRFKPPRDFADD